MGLKRVRTPHYINGFGNGEVRDKYEHNKKAAVNNVRTRGDKRLAAQEHPALVADRWSVYFDESESGDEIRSSSPTEEPWQMAPLALLIVVVLLSALFLHVISDAQKAQYRVQFERKRRKRAPSKKTRKKKTDEWNADEEDLLSESIRSVQSADVDDPKTNLYYPYTPQQPGVQQHRHRKSSATASSYAPPAFQQKSYYLNQSGGAVIASYKPQTPSSSRVVRPIVNPPANASPLGAGKESPGVESPALRSHAANLAPAMPVQRSSMNPQILSSASSFDSSLGSEKNCPPSGDRVTLRLSPKESPLRSSSHLLLSPGTDDLSPRSKKLQQPRITELVDQTPRVSNRKTLTTPTAPFPEPAQASYGSETYKFASPPSLRERREETEVPMLPNLDVHVAHTRPPRSVNLDELHLFQMMESGNVSHWQARVAEESQRLQDQVFPGQPKGQNTAASDPDSDQVYNEIPSNDPRKSIHHKRPDLTISTDASSSLQNAIDFAELRLVEVIGGGGFGQVWKAVWRGTPVAVKVLTGSAQSKNVPKAVLEEFVAEINLLKGMRHPNICLYMGACLSPPNRAIITELAANGSLWDALRLPLSPLYSPCDGTSRELWPVSLYLPDSKHGAPPSLGHQSPRVTPPRGTWPWDLVKRVACGAARGMAYLHSGKPPVLHRDLKSANILLDESYTAKVCDFGLSRLKAQGRSMTGNCGTVQWMAPEVLANMSYNEKADVYSFGIICWELLTRQCPFDGMTAIQCALAVLNKNQRPDIPRWCPPSLHALIRSCMKKNPDERPTFEQVLLALDAMP